MPKLTDAELADQLEALAKLYRANPELPPLYHLGYVGTEVVYCMTKADFSAAVKAFGPGEKSHDEEWLTYQPSAFPTVMVRGYKPNICVRGQTGSKRVPEQTIPAQPAREETVIPEHDEPVYEWICAPFLEAPSV